MKRVLFEIAFNGKNYHGWQIQENALTVQEIIEEKLSILIRPFNKVNIVGCGRTDKGVHAEQFFFHLDISSDINYDNFLYKLNQILPSDILVKSYQIVDSDFHARFSAINRTYEYRLTQKKEPFQNTLFSYISYDLDIGLMNNCCDQLISCKDFTSFSKVHTDVNNFICNVTDAFWSQKKHQLTFTIKSNRFLRNMVRAIVGTMLLVGRKKISVQDFSHIIESKNRSAAGPSAKAKGLFLVNVAYQTNE